MLQFRKLTFTGKLRYELIQLWVGSNALTLLVMLKQICQCVAAAESDVHGHGPYM